MKHILLVLSAALLLATYTKAQAPESFKYQAVVRNASNNIVSDQAVGMRLTILQGSATGTAVYTEEFSTSSNAFGLVNLEIGTGTTVDNFAAIDWGNGPYFIETAIDLAGGTSYNVMGASQLMSVPYALHATTAGTALNDNVDDADNNPNNELNTNLALSGTTLQITDAGGTLSQDLDGTFATDAEVAGTYLSTEVDGDPNNELNTGLALSGTTLQITDAGGTISQDLDGTFATDAEVASAYLSTEVDGDTTNELNTGLALSGTTLQITDAGGTLSQDLNGTFATDAEVASTYLSAEVDGDPNNELNTGLALSGTTLQITDAGGTLSQDLNGTFATDAEVASTYLSAEVDGDPNNELNTGLVLSGTTLQITDAGGTLSQDLNGTFATDAEVASNYLSTEVDGDSTNELQSLSISGNNLSISDGNTVALPQDNDWTVSGANMYSAVTGNVGIGTVSPDNLLDVNGKISLTQSAGDEMVIINDDIWQHGSGLQDFGTGGAHFVIASRETDYESAGLYGDGNVLTLWSPGDSNNGQPSALIYVCDEDRFDGATDNNPHNNNAVYAYLNTAGNWVAASDKNRKEDIKPLSNSLEKILAVNGYTYKFKLVEEEIKKGDVAPIRIGVLAQEVKEILPEVVEVGEDGSHYVSYTEFIPILIEATKEQQDLIEAQQAENDFLKQKLAEFEKRLEALEKE